MFLLSSCGKVFQKSLKINQSHLIFFSVRVNSTPVLSNKCYEQAVVSHVDHPSAFFIQFAHNETKYLDVQAKIKFLSYNDFDCHDENVSLDMILVNSILSDRSENNSGNVASFALLNRKMDNIIVQKSLKCQKVNRADVKRRKNLFSQ